MLGTAATLVALIMALPASQRDDTDYLSSPHSEYTTDATLNIDNPDPWSPQRIRADVRTAMRVAPMIRVQEAYPRTRAVISRYIRTRPNWRISHGPLELLTIYDRRTWAPAGPRLSRPFPASGRWGNRYLEWRIYRHRHTGAVVRIANGHADPACSRSTRRYARELAHWTPRDSIPTLFGGDLNCPQLPAAVYRAYRRDHGARLDHLLTTRSGPRTGRTWTIPMRSDHPMRVRRIHLP